MGSPIDLEPRSTSGVMTDEFMIGMRLEVSVTRIYVS